MADRTRYLVIVPRDAPATYAYLIESFRTLPDVEVVIDRRQPATAPFPKSGERRGGDRSRKVEAFGCTLVPRAPVREPAPSAPARHPLAPRLRLRSLPVLREG